MYEVFLALCLYVIKYFPLYCLKSGAAPLKHEYYPSDPSDILVWDPWFTCLNMNLPVDRTVQQSNRVHI